MRYAAHALFLWAFLWHCSAAEGSIQFVSGNVSTYAYVELDGVIKSHSDQSSSAPFYSASAVELFKGDPSEFILVYASAVQNLTHSEVPNGYAITSSGTSYNNYEDWRYPADDQSTYEPHAKIVTETNLAFEFVVHHEPAAADVLLAWIDNHSQADTALATYQITNVSTSTAIYSSTSQLQSDMTFDVGHYRVTASWYVDAEVDGFYRDVWTGASQNFAEFTFSTGAYVVPEAESFAVWGLLLIGAVAFAGRGSINRVYRQ